MDEIEKSRREKRNELKNLFATDNDRIDLLLELNEIIRDLKAMLKKNKIKRNRLVIRDYISDIITSLQYIIISKPSIQDLVT